MIWMEDILALWDNFMKGLKKTMQNLFPIQDWNPGPPEFEAGVLVTTLQYLLQVSKKTALTLNITATWAQLYGINAEIFCILIYLMK